MAVVADGAAFREREVERLRLQVLNILDEVEQPKLEVRVTLLPQRVFSHADVGWVVVDTQTRCEAVAVLQKRPTVPAPNVEDVHLRAKLRSDDVPRTEVEASVSAGLRRRRPVE